MSENTVTEQDRPTGQTARLVVSWLIVGIPLAYALYQTITSIIPLFTGA